MVNIEEDSFLITVNYPTVNYLILIVAAIVGDDVIVDCLVVKQNSV
jgi:hypothetical protein